MAKLFEMAFKSKIVPKTRAWLRGKKGPSEAEILREAQRIVRLRQQNVMQLHQLKLKSAREFKEKLGKLPTGSGEGEFMEAAQKILEQHADAMDKVERELHDELNSTTTRRLARLSAAHALRVVGFEDKAQARKVLASVVDKTHPALKEKGQTKFAARASAAELKELLGAGKAKKFMREFARAGSKAATASVLADKIGQEKRRQAEILLGVIKKKGWNS